MSDFRHACRALWGARWYSSGVVATLTLGLTLATVAFAVVDGVLFRPLSYARPGELVLFHAGVSSAPRREPPLVSWHEAETWKEAIPEIPVTVIAPDREPSEIIRGREYAAAAIDERFFDVIGARPLLGGFSAEDFYSNRRNEPVSLVPTLIGYRAWRHTYGGDPAIVGRAVITRVSEGRQYGMRIAGVLPDGLLLPVDGREIGALRPLPRSSLPSRRDFQIVARMPSASASGAVRDRLLESTRRLALLGEPPPSGHHSPGEPRQPFDNVRLVPIGTHLAAKERPAFALVFAAAALLLFLACVNVAGLVAARNIDRRREHAVRRALGADRWRLLRGIIFELGLLTGASVGLAFLLARPMLIVTLELLPASIAVLKEPAIDSRVVVAAALFATVCLLVVSVWPMLVTTRVGVSALLGSHSTSTPRRRRSSAALIASQVALGFALLTAGGLSIASLAEAYRNDTGYRRDHSILLELYHMRAFGPNDSIEALRALPGSLEQVPGVSHVAISTVSPLFVNRSNVWTSVVPQGWSGPIEGVISRQVSGNFFEVLGLRLIDGRWPGAGEWTVDQPVALVSETAARVLWPDRSAVGRTLVARSSPLKPQSRTVIGVVADARYSGLDADPLGDIYLPDPLASQGRYGAFFHVRTTRAAETVLPVILSSLSGRGFRIEQASTHEDALFASVKHRVLPAWLFGTLGFGALLLTGVGVLGLLAMSAAQRTREVGIRIAIGATPSCVVRELLREQLGAVLVGLAGGMLVSAVAARFIEAHLYRISPFDPMVWAIGAVTVIGVAAAGAWIPSTRASRVDPVQALRAE